MSNTCAIPPVWRPPWISLSLLLLYSLHLPTCTHQQAAITCQVQVNADGSSVSCNAPNVVAVSNGPSALSPYFLNVTNSCQLPPSLPISQPPPMLSLCIPADTHLVISNISISGVKVQQAAFVIAVVVGPGSTFTLMEGYSTGVTGATPLAVMLGTGSRATIANYKAVNNSVVDRSGGGLQVFTYSDQPGVDPSSVASPAADFTLVLRNCTFQRNVAYRAAGVLVAFPGGVNWRLAMVNTSFINNEAMGKGGGGAIMLNTELSQAGVITLQDVVVRSNMALNGSGGGILADLTSSTQVTMTLNGSTGVILQRNKALQGAGGGMWVSMANATQSKVVIDGASTVFDRNMAISGGGLFANMTNSRDCRVELGGNETVFEGNVAFTPTAAQTGGGTDMGEDININYNDGGYDNDPDFRPIGPVTFFDPVMMAGIDEGFIQNDTVVPLSGSGGALFVSLVGSTESALTMARDSQGLIQFNQARYGAGIFFDLAADYALGAWMSTAGIVGDGVVDDGGVLGDDGQAVQAVPVLPESATLVLDASGWRVESNNASHRGGGLYVSLRNTSQPDFQLNGAGNFFNNTAGIAGGGVYLDQQYSTKPRVVLNGSALRLSANSAGSGAGMYINQQDSSTACSVLLSATGRTEISNNAATYNAGGIMVNQTGCISSSVVMKGGELLFINNSAEGSGGGLVANQTGARTALLSVNGSHISFINNTASSAEGGAVLANQTACRTATAILDGTLSNFSNNTAGTNGGGFAADQANSSTARFYITGRQTVFSSNRALRGAGVVVDHSYVSDTLVNIGGFDTQFNDNMAASVGGGVLVTQANSTRPKVVLSGSSVEFNGNNATLGGGVYVQQTNGTGASLTMDSTTLVFFSNQAGVNGGGVYLDHENALNSSLLILSPSATFQNNSAVQSGAGVFAEYSNSVNPVVLVGGLNTSMINNTCGRGGGGMRLSLIDADSPQVLINSSSGLYFNNSAGSGGFLYASLLKADNAVVSFNGSAIMQGNVANYSGGAIYMDLSASNSTVWVNATEAGGPISFVDNVASSGSGGAFYIGLDPLDPWSSSRVVVDGCEQGCEFRNNSAVRGGGLLISGDARNYTACPDVNVTQCNLPPLQLSNYRFVLNRAVKGGGVMTSNTTVEITQVSFENNTADDAGGGLYIDSSWKTWVVNANFSFNRAFRGGGIALLQGDDEKSQLILSNSNSTYNLASTDGGALLTDGGVATIINSTLVSNTARLHGGAVCFISRQCVRGSVCTAPSSSPVALQGSTNITKNLALAGGGVFVSAWTDTAYNITDFVNGTDVAVGGNAATYSRDLSFPPITLDIDKSVEDMVFPSTGGDRGLIPLVVNVSTPGIQIRVDLIGVNPQVSNASLLGFLENSNRNGVARFDKLRILGGAPGLVQGEDGEYVYSNAAMYTLRVSTPDYPLLDPEDIKITIRSCIAGEFHENSTNTCNICSGGTYTVTPNQTSCQPCAAELLATCEWGAIRPTAGHWQAGFRSDTIRPCPNFQACYGLHYMTTPNTTTKKGLNTTTAKGLKVLLQECQLAGGSLEDCQGQAYSDRFCSEGYRGHLCASCAEGYGKNKLYTCGKCTSKAAARSIYAITLIVTCAIVIFTSNSVVSNGLLPPTQKNPITVADLFKVISVYLQYLGVISTLNVGRPDGLQSVYALQDVVGSGPSRSVAMSCMGITNVGVELWLTMLFPFIVTGIGFALWSGFCSSVARTVKLGGMEAIKAWNSLSRWDLLAIVTMVAIQFSYSVMVYTAFTPFVCLSVYLDSGERARFWGWDMDVMCGTQEHGVKGIPVGVIGVIGACFVIPVALILGLRALPAVPTMRHRIRYNFLYIQYRPKRRWWEGMICIRTAVLVAFSLFFKQYGVSKQLVTMTILLLADTVITLWQVPYRFRLVHMLNLASNMVLMVTCLGSLALPDLDGLFTMNDGMLSPGFRSFQKFLVVALLIWNVSFIALILWIAVLVEVAKADSAQEGMLASSSFSKVYKILSVLTCGLANRQLMEENDDDYGHKGITAGDEEKGQGIQGVQGAQGTQGTQGEYAKDVPTRETCGNDVGGQEPYVAAAQDRYVSLKDQVGVGLVAAEDVQEHGGDTAGK